MQACSLSPADSKTEAVSLLNLLSVTILPRCADMVFAEACLLTEIVLQAGNSAIAETNASSAIGFIFLLIGVGASLTGSAKNIGNSR